MRLAALTVSLIAGLLLLAGCTTADQSPQRQESQIRQSSYKRLAAQQPAHSMKYSPSRDTINFWIDTWGSEPGKLSYVYLLASNGQLIGYYVFKGLPITLCAALTPTYDFIDLHGDGNDKYYGPQVPAPGVDGVYYSGGQCNDYYGKDAATGQYIEFTTGGGINMLVYEKPLPLQGVEPLGFTLLNGRKR